VPQILDFQPSRLDMSCPHQSHDQRPPPLALTTYQMTGQPASAEAMAHRQSGDELCATELINA